MGKLLSILFHLVMWPVMSLLLREFYVSFQLTSSMVKNWSGKVTPASLSRCFTYSYMTTLFHFHLLCPSNALGGNAPSAWALKGRGWCTENSNHRAMAALTIINSRPAWVASVGMAQGRRQMGRQGLKVFVDLVDRAKCPAGPRLAWFRHQVHGICGPL